VRSGSIVANFAVSEGVSTMDKAKFISRNECVGCGSRKFKALSSGLFDGAPLRDFLANDPWGENPMPYLAGEQWCYVKCDACGLAFHRQILLPEWNELTSSGAYPPRRSPNSREPTSA
jgi:hypothetical protein